MADKKITQLPAVNTVTATDLLAVVASNITSQIAVEDLVESGVGHIPNNTIAAAKVNFTDNSVKGTAIKDGEITANELADDSVSSTKLANNSSVKVVETTLPSAGDFIGQIGYIKATKQIFIWDNSNWLKVSASEALTSVNAQTSGVVVIIVDTDADTGAITLHNQITPSESAGLFMAGPVSQGGAVDLRTIDPEDLPVATNDSAGAIIVDPNRGLSLTGVNTNILGIANTVAQPSGDDANKNQLVKFNDQGLITSSSSIQPADLPFATPSTVGGVRPGGVLTVDVNGILKHNIDISEGSTFTKVTVNSEGHVTDGTETLAVQDIPDLPATIITRDTFGEERIADDAISGKKLKDFSTVQFVGAEDDEETAKFPDPEFTGQFVFNQLTKVLSIAGPGEGNARYIPINALSGGIVFCGTFNASTGKVVSVTADGELRGFTANAVLPAPSLENKNCYVIVATAGTPNNAGGAPSVALNPPDILISSGAGPSFQVLGLSATLSNPAASNVSYVAGDGISANNVQAAIQELNADKISSADPEFTGTATFDYDTGNSAPGSLKFDYENDFSLTITPTVGTQDQTITIPSITGTLVTTSDTNSVTSVMIDSSITNANIAANANIAVAKIAPGTDNQILQSKDDGSGTIVTGFFSALEVPGELTVQGVASFLGTNVIIQQDLDLSQNLIFKRNPGVDLKTVNLKCVDNPSDNYTITLPDGEAALAATDRAQTFTKGQVGNITTVTYSSIITLDLTQSNNFEILLTGSGTLANPTTEVMSACVGQSGIIRIKQDSEGDRTLNYDSFFQFVNGDTVNLTIAPNKVDLLGYYVDATDRISVFLAKNLDRPS